MARRRAVATLPEGRSGTAATVQGEDGRITAGELLSSVAADHEPGSLLWFWRCSFLLVSSIDWFESSDNVLQGSAGYYLFKPPVTIKVCDDTLELGAIHTCPSRANPCVIADSSANAWGLEPPPYYNVHLLMVASCYQ